MASMEEKLLIGVLSQMEVGRINYDLLAKDIGVATSKAARCRWDRYRQKLTKGAGLQSKTAKKAVGMGKNLASASPKKAGVGPKKIGRGSPKKSRGRGMNHESDEEEVGVDTDEEEEEMDYDKEGTDVEIKMKQPVTPSRKLPSRRARVTKFVEETSDAEDEQEEEDGDMQLGAEVGGMEDLAVKDENDADELSY